MRVFLLHNFRSHICNLNWRISTKYDNIIKNEMNYGDRYNQIKYLVWRFFKHLCKLSHLNEHLFSQNDVPFEECGLLNDSVCTGQYSVSWCGIIDESCCVKHVGGKGQGIILGITPVIVLRVWGRPQNTFQNNSYPD